MNGIDCQELTREMFFVQWIMLIAVGQVQTINGLYTMQDK